MARLFLRPIGSSLSDVVSGAERERNLSHMGAREEALAEKVKTTRAGWGETYVKRVHEKGKLTTWERIDALVDPGTEVFEIGTLVNWGRTFPGSRREAPGAGVVTCFARIGDRWCVVIANDNTVASGAWWPLTPEKIERAQKMALRLRLPVVYLVDCSGLFLPEQSRSFSGPTGAGHIFTQNARLAANGVPQIAGVFGDCIAGGGYMPIISDRVYMTESAYMVIAGAALIRGAKSLKLTSLDIGGPEVHVHQSGCADVRLPDDPAAIAMIRSEVCSLPSSAVDFYRHGVDPAPPRFDPAELGALFAPDPRQTYDIVEVIARLVDDSLFHEVLADKGREMVTGVARISGLWVGLIANRQGLVDEPGVGRRAGGVLYREGIAKISAFARACNDDGIPLVWLQDISGFDIGVEAERLGLLGYGSNLIYTNANPQVPIFTVLLRKASGAGYYAMSGMPYEPVVQLSTPMTRLAVMEGRTLAIAAFNSKLDDDFEIAETDPEKRAAIAEGMADMASRIESDMDPVKSAARMDTDEVVPLSALRSWLCCLVESAWQACGYRRTKNPRIWSLHDLAVLTGDRGPTVGEIPATASSDTLGAPSAGTWAPSVRTGGAVLVGDVLGHLDRVGSRLAVTVPAGIRGVILTVHGASDVGYDEPLVTFGLQTGEPIEAETGSDSSEGLPPGVVEVCSDTDGTFYSRPEPGAPEFVSVAGSVDARSTLGLIEVMKTFNPVRAPIAGVVAKVCVEDGGGVEAGQVLFWIQTAD
jgi:3-methylcrotonyl-CoA carboxylase beta subunit